MVSRRNASELAPTVAVLALLLASTAGADPSNRVLAPNGDIFQVTQGTYGELFPGRTEALADDPVLALSVIRPDGSSERLLVPETAGPAEDELASLVLGPDGATLHVLWQSSVAGSRLKLASLDAEGWGEVADVSRAIGVVRGSPRAAVTRDRAELSREGSEALALVHRSVLHVVWLEEVDGAVIYAPLVIEDGAYIGDHALYALDRLAAAGREPGADTGEILPTGALPAIAIEPGDDAGSALAAFTDPESGLLLTVELRMIAGELSDVGNRLRDKILDLTVELEPGSPDSLRSLAGGARAQLISVGHRLQPALLQLLAGEIEQFILETGSDWAFQPEAMAERTRGELISIGAAFDHTPVRRLHGGARAQLISVGHRWGGALPSHDLKVRVTAERALPDLPGDTIPSLFLSGDGVNAVVAWELEGVVYFRESDDEAESGWGPVRSLGIIAGEEPSLVVDLLRARVRSR